MTPVFTWRFLSVGVCPQISPFCKTARYTGLGTLRTEVLTKYICNVPISNKINFQDIGNDVFNIWILEETRSTHKSNYENTGPFYSGLHLLLSSDPPVSQRGDLPWPFSYGRLLWLAIWMQVLFWEEVEQCAPILVLSRSYVSEIHGWDCIWILCLLLKKINSTTCRIQSLLGGQACSFSFTHAAAVIFLLLLRSLGWQVNALLSLPWQQFPVLCQCSF